MHLTARAAVVAAILWLATSVGAQTTTPPPSKTSAASPSITAVSNCHAHGTVNWCMVGTEEFQVVGPTKTEEMEARYTDCHKHGADTYCVDSHGEDVKILFDQKEGTGETEEHDHSEHEGTEKNCHFHAGVEHCVGGDAEEDHVKCDATDRDYNIPLRIGLLFVILTTSGIGVFGPILTTRFNLVRHDSIVFIYLKQFGTGIVISTAFVHLFTHAQLMFANKCLGELEYEATTAAIFLAGLILSFLVDYLGARFVQWRQNKRVGNDSEAPSSASDIVHASASEDKSAPTAPATTLNNEFMRSHGLPHAHGPLRVATPLEEKINVMNLEAGIVFHSILIGITLVVAGDSFFITLFVVIVFHQMFEGIALGTCIAELPKAAASTLQKLIMAGIFTLITPIGMAIGIGVLDKFNGNDPSTIVAIGTLDALSAGILAWVGIVEMLARDWLHGKLLKASMSRTTCALLGLVSGLVLMSLLGKWA